jgi:hypothetical protein
VTPLHVLAGARLTAALAERYAIERLLGESEVAANLRHPHILMLIDSSAADG